MCALAISPEVKGGPICLQEPRHKSGLYRIGIIDDSDFELDNTRAALSEHLQRTVHITPWLSGKQALKEIDEENNYDAIIIDQNLARGEKGVDVYFALRKACIMCPILIMSIAPETITGTHGIDDLGIFRKPTPGNWTEAREFARHVEKIIRWNAVENKLEHVLHEQKDLKKGIRGMSEKIVTKDDLQDWSDNAVERIMESVSVVLMDKRLEACPLDPALCTTKKTDELQPNITETESRFNELHAMGEEKKLKVLLWLVEVLAKLTWKSFTVIAFLICFITSILLWKGLPLLAEAVNSVDTQKQEQTNGKPKDRKNP